MPSYSGVLLGERYWKVQSKIRVAGMRSVQIRVAGMRSVQGADTVEEMD